MAIEEEEEELKVPGPQIKYSVVAKFVFFSFLMIATPTTVFMLSYHRYFDGLYAMTIGVPDQRSLGTVSGILAIIAVNLVVGMFVVSAFQETDVVKDKRKGVKSD
eukprot:TRINITY_DN11046_c0_g1_i3.p2 TRINITY_DN11046_c0_g1~~TRINITY_DN11046_c0_g1_i3.p2  ORF type:complete len:105 (+),score=14.26 TRINITY_DN11046_c0_g1_i3:187-501(+)